METCQTKSGECGSGSGGNETARQGHEGCRSECGCGGKCGGDPTECAIQMWGSSFVTAMKAAQVDILKSKIQKAWGPMFEKGADAVIAAMEVKWKGMLANASAKEELKEKLKEIWKKAA